MVSVYQGSAIPSSPRGFTVIEILISLLIASIIMTALFLSFGSQSKQFKYENKRVDAAQQLEFALRRIAMEMQNALMFSSGLELSGAGVASVAITNHVSGFTEALAFQVWDPGKGYAQERGRRCIVFDAGMIKYDRDEPSVCSPTLAYTQNTAILGEVGSGIDGMRVTHFRVFNDGIVSPDRANYTGIPMPLTNKVIRDMSNIAYDVPAFTIAIEIEVDKRGATSIENSGTFNTNILGQAVGNGKQRLWRYIQVSPNVVLDQ